MIARAVTPVAGLLGGCSLIRTEPPLRPDPDDPTSPACSTSLGPPLGDVVLAGLSEAVVGESEFLDGPDPSELTSKQTARVAVAIGLPVAIFLGSAVYGFRNNFLCTDAKDHWEDRMRVEPEPVVLAPPPPLTDAQAACRAAFQAIEDGAGVVVDVHVSRPALPQSWLELRDQLGDPGARLDFLNGGRT